MIYFTSDLHLGHENAIKLCNRPFGSVEEMDETLIQNWNSRVTNNDTIYILGDMMFRIHKPPEEYLSRLKGKKHLLLGNHDKTWIKKCDLSKWFVSVNDLLHTSDGQHNISLCHYPMMSFPHMRRNGYMIFGHIHRFCGIRYSFAEIIPPHEQNAGRFIAFGEKTGNNVGGKVDLLLGGGCHRCHVRKLFYNRVSFG